ncbi:MAG: hypothetical protein KC501_41015 [Myxococcales bacterium]|nr:hypothetical protein [Myxococcales bacterium]
MGAFPNITSRSLIPKLMGGGVPYTASPVTYWRQTIRASDLSSTAATVTAVGTVGAIADGNFVLDFHDREGTLVDQITVPVGGGDPPDEAGLAEDIADAVTVAAGGGGDLEGYVSATSSDAENFTVAFVAGQTLTVSVNSEPTPSITIEHLAEIVLSELDPNRAFPRNVYREVDPYVRVTEAWAAGTVVTVDDNGVASSDVLVQAPLDALGAQETASASTLGGTAATETDWDPVVLLELGDDASPTAGVFELLVPLSPILTPEPLP